MVINYIDLIVLSIVLLCIGSLIGIQIADNMYIIERDAAIDRLNDCIDILQSPRSTVPAWLLLNMTVENVS